MAYILFYFIEPLPVKIRFRNLHFQGAIIGKIYAIGIPAALNMALPSILISALNGILSTFADAYVVALGAYFKLQTFIYLPANGIIQGIRPLVGYNYGAGEYKRVRNIFYTALALASAIMLAGLLLCWIAPGMLMQIFTSTPETIAIGTKALRIISLGFIFSCVSVICCGALEGLGAGMPSLCISLLRYLVIILPAALLFTHYQGAVGVWIAFPFTEILTACFAWIIYQQKTRRMFR